ncbi:MAG: putative AAA+ superfamily ATPase [Rhodothermales bacterium]|jgi:predicted AAA+ superfamily ATPase
MIIKRRLAQTIRNHWDANSFIQLAGPQSAGRRFLAERIFHWSKEDGAPQTQSPDLLKYEFNTFRRGETYLVLEKDWPELRRRPQPYVALNPSPGNSRFTLLPVTLSELGTIPKKSADFMLYLMRGGYPGGLDPRFRPGDFYTDFLAEWYAEIRGRLIRPSLMETFKRFMRLCAEQSGSMLNCSRLARALGVSQPLVRRWVDVLVREHLVHLLPVYPESFCRRVVRTPKLYFWDTGIMCAAMGIYTWMQLLGPGSENVQETWLVGELRKTLIHEGISHGLYYWRDRRGLHLPLILHTGPNRVVMTMEDSRPARRDSPELKEWTRLAGSDWKLVRALTSSRFIDRHGIHHIPWHAVPELLVKPIAPINRTPVGDWVPAEAESRFVSLPQGASMAQDFADIEAR